MTYTQDNKIVSGQARSEKETTLLENVSDAELDAFQYDWGQEYCRDLMNSRHTKILNKGILFCEVQDQKRISE